MYACAFRFLPVAEVERLKRRACTVQFFDISDLTVIDQKRPGFIIRLSLSGKGTFVETFRTDTGRRIFKAQVGCENKSIIPVASPFPRVLRRFLQVHIGRRFGPRLLNKSIARRTAGDETVSCCGFDTFNGMYFGLGASIRLRGLASLYLRNVKCRYEATVSV